MNKLITKDGLTLISDKEAAAEVLNQVHNRNSQLNKNGNATIKSKGSGKSFKIKLLGMNNTK